MERNIKPVGGLRETDQTEEVFGSLLIIADTIEIIYKLFRF